MSKRNLPPEFSVAVARILLRLAMVAIGAYLLLNSGCVTVSEHSPCDKLDWYEIGRQDGVAGERPTVFETHVRECQARRSRPDQEIYLNGYNAGLVEFCSPQGGLEAGKAGRSYAQVCPEHLERRFLPAYEVGRNIHLLERENADIESRIQEIFTRLSSLTLRRTEQADLQKRLEELRRRRAKNELQIDDIEGQFFERL